MPVVLSWLLPAPSTSSPVASVTVGTGAVPCDAPVYTQAELLEVLGRAYPQDYMQGLQQSANSGYEQMQAAAAVGVRVSLALARWLCCSFLMHAHDGARAGVLVEFFREVATAGPLTIKAGSIVSTPEGREFRTLLDVAFGALDLGPFTVMCEAVGQGYGWNVLGQRTTAGNETLEGEVSVTRRLLLRDTTNQPMIDPAMRVRNLLDATGGADACLDALGQDLGVPRNVHEAEGSYRLRIQQAPDTISPAAIRRGVDRILAPLGLGCCLREVGTPLFPGFFYDAPPSTDPANNFAYDMDFDLRPEDRFKLLLSLSTFRGFFLVGVPDIVDSAFPGFLYDGHSGDAFPVTNAYDTTAVNALFGAYDGSFTVSTAVYKAISDDVDARRAGGVGFTLYVERVGCF